MQYLAAVLPFLLCACATPQDAIMSTESLSIELRCPNNTGCIFSGDNIPIEIIITNHARQVVGVPISYIRGTGPVIRLVDVTTGRETYLRKNLADLALTDELTQLQPGQSETVAWVINSSEIEQFGRPVDISAEAAVSTIIHLDGELMSFEGRSTVRIVEERINP